MRNIILFLFSIVSLLCWNSCSSFEEFTEHKIQKNAVDGLIKRLIGEEKSKLFNITIHKQNVAKKDTFSVNKIQNIIQISATSGVAAAYGFHYYLKNYCKAHVSWDYDQLKIPTILPDVDVGLISMDKFRYYQNVVVYSYSYAWWTWERWEREIDWMALNGMNLALAFTGQETIWLNIYKQMNMTQNEINEHFSGSWFLAWNRMGNLRGWGGNLTKKWHENSLDLQRKILKRMRSLGIIPILPAFCGHLPRAFERLYPHVRMTKLLPWVHFEDEYCCPFLLDPKEKLFRELGEKFMFELKKQFGLTHYYNCDTFNEMINPFEDVKNLSTFSSAVFDAMVKVDENATWILQGWLFVDNETYWTRERAQNYLSGVPNDRMIVLDLQSETAPQYLRLNSYFGKPFIWCMLHNFGGNLGMHGSFDIVNERVIEARNAPNSTMIGTGITPEGINQNYVIYDFMTESSWRNSTIDTDEWVEKYSERRYVLNNNNLKFAWKLLKNSVYNYKLPERLHGSGYIVCRRPSLRLKPLIWYNVSDVLNAWDLFLNTSNVVKYEELNDNYLYDLIDVTRQALQLLFDQTYLTLMDNYSKRDINLFEDTARQLLEILVDFERILSTNSKFMLGAWLNSIEVSAMNSSLDVQSSINYAKNQITLWGPKGEILDYATRQWSGVVIDYYYPRWALFFHYLSISIRTKTKFNKKKFNDIVFEAVEDPFCKSNKTYPVKPESDTLSIAKIIHVKWRNLFKII
ncbi:alpha-N-acetylglucosaminidase [Planococcus citri]|uniref:alpha-N-acetylglucosaminidase n=1 Tax=Planococcus citri TaxID=170843 RepID=UPI0031FA22AD